MERQMMPLLRIPTDMKVRRRSLRRRRATSEVGALLKGGMGEESGFWGRGNWSAAGREEGGPDCVHAGFGIGTGAAHGACTKLDGLGKRDRAAKMGRAPRKDTPEIQLQAKSS